MIDKDSLQKFCNNHQIKIIDDKKQKYYVERDYLNSFYNLDIQCSIKSEELYTIEITKNEMNNIVSFEEQVYRCMNQYGHVDLFQMLLDKNKEEESIRSKYPAIQKLYDQYKMMLNLVKSSELK